ncbi:hypothetical protein [Paracoccus pantotrophus]|uniref:hypothetical protein n=1 Tax=Paracoccus pantotrophus TaxID=82367 RepID=UPI00142EF67F|nr:hypothetical protein [Paracoccus pantotrophus]
MDYSMECARGRAEAAHDLAAICKTGNMPLLVQKIRAAAANETGFGVGYLYALAERAAQ